MKTTAIDYIRQAIKDSERSDEIQLIDDDLRLKAEAARLTQLLRIHSTVVAGRELAVKTPLVSMGQ